MELSKSALEEVVKTKEEFIDNFINAQNTATASKVDANANVTQKDLAVLESELYKDFTIAINRDLACKKMKEIYGETEGGELAKVFKKFLDNHIIYCHDETSLKPYCASVSLYPFLLEGTKGIGGTSKPPTNLKSFCGSFCNLVYQLASNFAGAIATVEFLMYFDYFARKDYGDDYLHTHTKEIKQDLQGVVYTLNQPAAARGNQSVFWNISIFDKSYFSALFSTFVFPDGSAPKWDTLRDLQAFFLDWFAEERTKELLTFPVLTAAYLVDPETHKVKSEDFRDTLARAMANGLSFFHYESTSADSLSSCCRLRNELADNTFSYSLGAGGVATGSFQVITINMNRVATCDDDIVTMMLLDKIVDYIHKFLYCYRAIIKDYIDSKLLPAYSAYFINLNKQFGTIGINGMLEAYENTHHRDVYKHMDNYKDWLIKILAFIKHKNTEARKPYGFRFNTEFVPAENLGVKNAKWDKEDGLIAPRDCYNSYFFPVEDSRFTIIDKLKLHGRDVSENLDGGAACHINLSTIPTFEQCCKLIDLAAKYGVPYWTTNVLTTMCKHCGRIDPETRTTCKYCGSDDVEYATRIIGYLKPISSFSKERQKEAGLRFYERI